MDHHSGLTLVLHNLQEHRQILEEELSKGTCETFEDYKFRCGQVESILYAEREILDMLERIEIS